MKKKFKKFLKKQGAWKAYKKNCKKNTNLAYLDRDVNIPTVYLSNAFFWNETNQGFTYWNDLNIKWEKKLNK